MAVGASGRGSGRAREPATRQRSLIIGTSKMRLNQAQTIEHGRDITCTAHLGSQARLGSTQQLHVGSV
jgi:hypothetical protein